MQSPTMTYHVLPVGAVWKVGLPGDSLPSSFHVTREDAIDHAEQLARRHTTSAVIVHKADGTVDVEEMFSEGRGPLNAPHSH
ncbi:MAG TPA: DUF2188 domain-containing protein [Polyangiaceae bacterium]|nr:DUF2188 domain-containing protein [Polyangiaceae bacterium]